ncbi:MAG: hypothetical protein ACFCU2_09395 [Acidimicrobiia bacterium]
MTVLQKNAATGIDLGQLARTVGKALAIGAIAVGVVFAVNSNTEPQGLSSAQLEAGNALNIADIGRPQATNAPFLAGTANPTHTGRVVTGGSAAAIEVDKADLLFKQKGAALADPSDRIHKQKAAELAK